MSYLIDRQAVIDLLKQMRKDGDMVPWEGKDVFARIRKLPTIQPEAVQLSKEGTTSDLISKTETVERLRGVLEITVPITDHDGGYVDGVEVGISTVSTMPTIQPEPSIPVSWIENEIEWLKSLDNTFSEITALQISAMVKKWRDEKK